MTAAIIRAGAAPPDSLPPDAEVRYVQADATLAVRRAYCKGCDLCVDACPAGILALDGEARVYVTDIGRCLFCGVCAARCPDFVFVVVPGAKRAGSEGGKAMSLRLVMGNEAVVHAAVIEGCDFFAGYPITPATEILEEMARILPPRGGVFLQMEDELAAMAAVIGGAWGGARAMTATSGPGFSLMQENLGYAAMTQTPCVVVDCQRAGPSTGLPTLPAQGEVMQARFGSHGDRPALVLTASSVAGAFERTRLAFRLAERHRLPVVLLLDAVVAHMREPLDLPALSAPSVRAWPAAEADGSRFGAVPFLPLGEGAPTVVTGLAHGADGRAGAGAGMFAEGTLRHATTALETDPELLDEAVGRYRLDDADVVVVAFGITARAARAAVDRLRAEEVRAGLLDLRVLWPFPDAAVAESASRARAVIVAELNLGQAVLPVRAAVAGRAPVFFLGRADGGLLAPDAIASFVLEHRGPNAREVLRHA